MDALEKYNAHCFDSENATKIPLHESIKNQVFNKISDTKNAK